MDRFIIYNLCAVATVAVIIAVFTIIYRKVLKKKDVSTSTYFKVISIILSVSFVISILGNIFFINNLNEERSRHYSIADFLTTEDIYDVDENGAESESRNLSVLGKYYKEDSIPRYERTELVQGDIKYTYYKNKNVLPDSNEYKTTPNLIIYAEYIGEEIPDFAWKYTSADWIDEEKVISSLYSSGSSRSRIIMICCNYDYDTDEVKINLNYGSFDSAENIISDKLIISCK